MRKLMKYAAAVAVAALMSGPAFAQIDFADGFESYDLYVGPGDFQGDIGGGWLAYAAVFGPYPTCGTYWYRYGDPFPAPNRSGGFSNITAGASGQALNTFTDYQNGDQENGCVETSIFQERVFTAADAGTYEFQFSTEVPGPLGPDVSTFGFVKLLDPNNGYSDVFGGTKVSDTASAGAKAITVDLDASSEGFILQWGFTTVASQWQDSGRWYDNVTFALEGVYDPPTGSFAGFEGIPIPKWALLLMAAMLAWVGATRLRSHRQ